MPDTFSVSLVTPEAAVLDTEASYVDLPAHDGQLGVMRGRAPLLAEMGIGALRINLTDDSQKLFVVDGGFAQMVNDKLTLLCEKAIAAEDLDLDESKAAFAEAEALQPITPELAERREHDLALARIMLKVAEESRAASR